MFVVVIYVITIGNMNFQISGILVIALSDSKSHINFAYSFFFPLFLIIRNLLFIVQLLMLLLFDSFFFCFLCRWCLTMMVRLN